MKHTPVPVRLDADVLRAWVSGAVDLLAEHRSTLDALNVFPVADSDTGTNLYLTLREGDRAVAALATGASTDAVSRALTRGTLVGARGNSGVIVSQYLAGLLAEPAEEPETFAAALHRAARLAYRAVAEPIEGTVLTVARAVGEAAVAAERGDVRDVLDTALDSGYRALVRTTDQLAPLRAAGVLDAGAWGLLLVLDALVEALGGRRSRRSRRTRSRRTARESARTDPRECSGHDHGGGAFEVMCIVQAAVAEDGAFQDLSRELSKVGASVAVVGGAGLWQAHVHTDHPLPAVDAAAAVGQVSQVRVRHIEAQTGVHGTHRPPLGLVTVTAAPGLAADLARAGAVVVLVRSGVAGAELERAVEDTGARVVLVLAADGLLGAARDPVDDPGNRELPRPRVRVVGGLSELQVVVGAATLAAHAPGADEDELAGAVTDAVTAVRAAEVDAAGVGPTRHARVVDAATSLLADGASLLTVLTGDDVPASVVDHLRAGVGGSGVDVVVLGTGNPGTTVLLGAE